nr:hypothetical protein [Bifidobacterium callitrichidarum]
MSGTRHRPSTACSAIGSRLAINGFEPSFPGSFNGRTLEHPHAGRGIRPVINTILRSNRDRIAPQERFGINHYQA